MEQDPLVLKSLKNFRIDLAHWNRLNTPDQLKLFDHAYRRFHYLYQESIRNRYSPPTNLAQINNFFQEATRAINRLEQRCAAEKHQHELRLAAEKRQREERLAAEERQRLEKHKADIAIASQKARQLQQQFQVNPTNIPKSQPLQDNTATAGPQKVSAAPLSPTDVLEQRWRYATIVLSSWQSFDPRVPGNLDMLNIISQRIQQEPVEKFAVWLFTCLQRPDLRALFKPTFIDKYLKKLSLAISQHYGQTTTEAAIPLIVVHQFFLNKFTQHWPAESTAALTADTEKLTELFMRQRNAGQMLTSFKEEKPRDEPANLVVTVVTAVNPGSAMTDSEERLSDVLPNDTLPSDASHSDALLNSTSHSDVLANDASLSSTDASVVTSNAFILIDKKPTPLNRSLNGSGFNAASIRGLRLPAAASYHGILSSMQSLNIPVTQSLQRLLDSNNLTPPDSTAAQASLN